MKMLLAAVAILVSTSAPAIELPDGNFFSGNDVHQWCQRDKAVAQSYVAGLYDASVHATLVIDSIRHFGKELPKNDTEVDYAIKRVVDFCKPGGATLEQVTDVFCKFLRDSPEERHGLPAILFNNGLKKAWPCPGK
jgi:3-hydroxy-3-methylglutaryl CoA synthase